MSLVLRTYYKELRCGPCQRLDEEVECVVQGDDDQGVCDACRRNNPNTCSFNANHQYEVLQDRITTIRSEERKILENLPVIKRLLQGFASARDESGKLLLAKISTAYKDAVKQTESSR